MSRAAETVLIRVALGASVRLSPHPSGIPHLPALILHSGDTARVTLQQAEQLYREGKIYHPITGLAPPAKPSTFTAPNGPLVSYEDGSKSSAESMSGGILKAGGKGQIEERAWAEYREKLKAEHQSAARFGDKEGRLSPTITLAR